MWLVQIGMCYNYKLNPGFQRLLWRNKCKYLINNFCVDYMTGRQYLGYIKYNILLKCMYFLTSKNVATRKF